GAWGEWNGYVLPAGGAPPRGRHVRPRLHRALADLRVEEGVVHVDDGVMAAFVGVLGRIDRGDLLPLEVGDRDVLALGRGDAGPEQDARRDEDAGQGSDHLAP